MTAETGRAFLLSAGRRAAFRLNCVTGAVECRRHAPLSSCLHRRKCNETLSWGFCRAKRRLKTGGGICMRLSTMSGPLVQQPYTVTAYPNVYFYLLGALADWPLAGDCALDRSFDKNGKISIFMWRIRDNNM